MDQYLAHHGILGQKWGVRRYQNEDGTLTEAGKKHLEKLDQKWAKKNAEKMTSKTKKKVQRELDAYGNELLKQASTFNANGKISSSAMNSYNKKMAELMNMAVGDIRAPSGRALQFVAKRGELGVYAALATSGYDMSQVKNGVWSSGRIAYKKKTVNMTG